MNALSFLLKMFLTQVQKALSLLKAGNVDGAISTLESLETELEKDSKE